MRKSYSFSLPPCLPTNVTQLITLSDLRSKKPVYRNFFGSRLFSLIGRVNHPVGVPPQRKSHSLPWLAPPRAAFERVTLERRPFQRHKCEGCLHRNYVEERIGLLLNSLVLTGKIFHLFRQHKNFSRVFDPNLHIGQKIELIFKKANFHASAFCFRRALLCNPTIFSILLCLLCQVRIIEFY